MGWNFTFVVQSWSPCYCRWAPCSIQGALSFLTVHAQQACQVWHQNMGSLWCKIQLCMEYASIHSKATWRNLWEESGDACGAGDEWRAARSSLVTTSLHPTALEMNFRRESWPCWEQSEEISQNFPVKFWRCRADLCILQYLLSLRKQQLFHTAQRETRMFL